MYDPFAAKNPFLSMWLSAANAWLGPGRGLWMAEWQRQHTAMMQEATEQMIRFWSGGWMQPFTSHIDDRPRRGR